MKAPDQIFHPDEFGQPTIVEQLRDEIASLRRQLAEAREECAKAVEAEYAEATSQLNLMHRATSRIRALTPPQSDKGET